MLGLVIFGIIAVVAARGQQGQWAAADNPTAKFMVDAERQWAEAACNHNRIAEKILAEDFQGTSPEGERYPKSEEVADWTDTWLKRKGNWQIIAAQDTQFGCK